MAPSGAERDDFRGSPLTLCAKFGPVAIGRLWFAGGKQVEVVVHLLSCPCLCQCVVCSVMEECWASFFVSFFLFFPSVVCLLGHWTGGIAAAGPIGQVGRRIRCKHHLRVSAFPGRGTKCLERERHCDVMKLQPHPACLYHRLTEQTAAERCSSTFSLLPLGSIVTFFPR